jgi:hypothetical protein
LTRNQVRYTGTQITIPMLAEPTSIQWQAFELLGAPILCRPNTRLHGLPVLSPAAWRR